MSCVTDSRFEYDENNTGFILITLLFEQLSYIILFQ